MRTTIAAAAVAMLASSGSAYAADCTKGLLWPYVRNPGDCLTDQEVKTGVYQGAPQGSVDVGSIKAPVQPVIPQDCHETGIWPFRSEECTPVATTSAKISAPPAPQPAVANTTPASPAPVAPATTEGTPAQAAAAAAQAAAAAAQAAAAAAQAAAAAAQAAAAAAPTTMPAVVTQASPAPAPVAVRAQAAPTTVSCSKPLLWPFVRESGDCNTAIEKADNKTNRAPVQASAPAAPVQPVAPVTMQGCHESGIWPFRSEECTTVTTTSATNSAAAAPKPAGSGPAAQSAPAPAVVTQTSVATPAAASCSKPLLWPFVRESGDCRTAAEKASGATDPVPVRASASAEPAPIAMPAVMQTSAAAAPAQAAPAAASCGKGLFWPFVRDSGDCATAAEKANGVTSPTPAVVPASAQADPAASQPTPAPANSGGCHKGVFWPFVREPGDCPTSSSMGQTH